VDAILQLSLYLGHNIFVPKARHSFIGISALRQMGLKIIYGSITHHLKVGKF
jgi:hypothetical protein